jgi:hypothetical protein
MSQSKEKIIDSPYAGNPPIANVSIEYRYQKIVSSPDDNPCLPQACLSASGGKLVSKVLEVPKGMSSILIVADLVNLTAANLFPPRR